MEYLGFISEVSLTQSDIQVPQIIALFKCFISSSGWQWGFLEECTLKDQRCPHCSDCPPIFWQAFSWCSSVCSLEPEAVSEDRGQDIFCEEPGPISLTQHWVASLEVVNYWESFSKASKDFWGGLIFLCGRGVARLFAGASCLWIVWEGGERGQQTGALVSLLSGEIYGPFYQNQQETQFMGKKNQYSQGLL